MARSPDVIVDPSPLDAPSVNVPLRVGWLLRTSRLNPRGRAALTAKLFAAELGVGPATVTKWEKGTEDIDAGGIEGYERLIGLPAGSLRGVIEITRRSFRYPTNPRLAPPRPPDDLTELSALVWPAMHGEPTGIDWLHFADTLNGDGPLVLPDFTAAPVLDRLASELARSVDSAYFTRYSAMARLRTGRYRDVALSSLLEFALAEDAQLSIDLLDVAGELPSAELFRAMCRLLVDDRVGVFHGACQSISNMAALGGISKSEMRDAVPLLVLAYNALADDPGRHARMSDLLRNLPPGVQSTAQQHLDRPPARVPAARTVVSLASPVYQAVQGLTVEITAELPARENPMLERVLFEAMFDALWVKQYTASLFLMALPYKDVISRQLARLAEHHGRPEVREAAAALSLRTGDHAAVATAEKWAMSGDLGKQVPGLITLGHWSTGIDRRILEHTVRGDWELARRALYAAGMSSSPILQEWAEDTSMSDQVRDAARWWTRVGGRVMT